MEADMKNMDKISVIIPVYNVEPYIRKCLDSVVNQTYRNLEIICVNDGSTDGSGKICDEYAAKDSRIRVFHKGNDGVSSAKNIGLKNIAGKYVGFVDSDDWIEPDMYEVLHKSAQEKNVPISVVSYFKDTDAKSTLMTNKTRIPDGIISTEDMLLYPLKRDYYMGFCGYLWNKLFFADIFLNNNLNFNEKINYAEDVLLYTKAILAGKYIGIYIDKPLYHYYQRKDSISHSESIDVKADILVAYKKVEKLLNENGYSNISYWARGFYCHHAIVIAEILQCEIKSHLNDYMETNKEFPEKFGRVHGLLSH
jgi:glycosyltransferase involved in cell wall biosynthesis